VSLYLCVSIISLEYKGLEVLEVQKKMIETQRHRDTKVIKSLINIEIIKLYTAQCDLFDNGEFNVNTRNVLVVSLQSK
jgi:hypothetical protein